MSDLNKIKNNEHPFLVCTLKGINKTYITEYYYSGKVVEKVIPSTLKYSTPILFFY